MTGLVKETALSPEQTTYVGAIEQSARTLLALIDEILDFSKIEAGKLELESRSFSLEDCIQSVVELLAARAFEKRISLAWAIDPSLPALMVGDEVRVRQIVLNLLGNAIKFTEQGGVVVRVERAGRTPLGMAPPGSVGVAITISDTGIGIPPERLRTLFMEFEQGDAAIHRRHGGTGLGLAISRRLARAMGGDIMVSSRQDKGSTFIAVIALDAAVGADAPRQTVACAGDDHVLIVGSDGCEAHAAQLTFEGNGIPVERASPAHAAHLIAAAATEGVPFSAVVAVEGCAPSELRSIWSAIATRPDVSIPRVMAVVDPGARSSFEAYRAAGASLYLTRPVRPAALLRQCTGAGSSDLAVATADDREPDAAAAPGMRCHVLLVEDNEINALLALRMLEKAGAEVTHVRNGREAVEFVRASLGGKDIRCDIILMDLHMPVMDGFTAAGEIRALASDAAGNRFELPPIVALTANAFAEDRRRCLDAGMDDYLAKPFEPSELMQLLDRWVHGAPAGARVPRSPPIGSSPMKSQSL